MLLLQVRLDRAGDSDRAEKKRNEADQVEEAVEIFERFAEVALPFCDGVEFQTEALHLRDEKRDLFLRINAGSELHVVAIMRDAAGLEQVGRGEILERNVNARRERTCGRCFARHLLQHAGDGELCVADFNRIANFHSELDEQTFFNDRAVALAKSLRRESGLRFHRTVEWKVATQRADVDETRPAGRGKNRHGGEAGLSRLWIA